MLANQSMTLSPPPSEARPQSPGRQSWLMLAVIAPMAVCYPATKAGAQSFGATLFFGQRGGASVTAKRLHPGKDLMSLTARQLVAGSVVLLGLSAVFEPQSTIA